MSGNIDGVSSVFDLQELYIPINKGQYHWLLLRVRLEDKTIKLWDSCVAAAVSVGYIPQV